MFTYILRRLILLPITLFFIVLVNFIVVNMAPGDPVTVGEITQQGAARSADRSYAFGPDERYLQFREFYGLTLPIVLNTWPYTSKEFVEETLWKIVHRKNNASDITDIPAKEYNDMRINFGDRSKFIMPILLQIIEDPKTAEDIRSMAAGFFVRGGSRQAILGPNLSDKNKLYNQKVGRDNNFLTNQLFSVSEDPAKKAEKIANLNKWYNENKEIYELDPTSWQKIKMSVLDTRFFRYMDRVVHLDFGTLRNDSNKTVVSEVVKRFKYSLTISILPMFITFFLCLIFGFTMALTQNRWPDYGLNVIFLTLYAIPVFVVAPFLIEKVALNHNFPFTNIPIPISGFTSPDSVYEYQTSLQRLFDVLQHIALPLVAIMYGTLATQSRLSRTAVLEVMNQDYVRTARAKGLSPFNVIYRHIGRNAAITIVTSIAGSLGIVLGGSLIVETLFEINGFGKFFYDAILNRDYNIIMFSALAGSFLTLLGYLAADIAYTILDPRVTLD